MAQRTYFAAPPPAPHTQCRRPTAYGALLYTPPACTGVDMGVAPRDWRTYRATRAPRVLLVSTWADARWGFPGGGFRPTETPAEALSREFKEETGAAIAFSDSDFAFASGTPAPPPPAAAAGAPPAEGGAGGAPPPPPPSTFPWPRSPTFSAKPRRTWPCLRAPLLHFPLPRASRVNEVFATCGMPLCYEAPPAGDAASAPMASQRPWPQRAARW